jgi:hypothetical protein
MHASNSAASRNLGADIPPKARQSRTLKIEPLGDPWRGRTFSGIRLKGHWLTCAGFLPGQKVSLKFISKGVIELRLISDSEPLESGPQVMKQIDFALAQEG